MIVSIWKIFTIWTAKKRAYQGLKPGRLKDTHELQKSLVLQFELNQAYYELNCIELQLVVWLVNRAQIVKLKISIKKKKKSP